MPSRSSFRCWPPVKALAGLLVMVAASDTVAAQAIPGAAQVARVSEEAEDAELQNLAERCGSQVGWLTDWSAAAERARAEGRLVFTLACLAGTEWPLSGPFSDPDLVALVRARFVPLLVEQAHGLPFAIDACDPLGLGLSIVIATPDGAPVAGFSYYNADCIYSACLQVLAERGADPDTLPAEHADDLALAELCLARGEPGRAARLLDGASSGRAHLLRATAFRLLREPDRALDAIADARREDAEAASTDVEEATILMRLGRIREAEALFAKHERADALYWRGACRVALSDLDGATECWKRAVGLHPESPWSWKAAADVTGRGCMIFGTERLEWPPRDIPPANHGLRVEAGASVAAAEHDAVRWLVENQRCDGTWGSPEEGCMNAIGWDQAIAAICARSLIPYRERPEVEAVVERTRSYLLAQLERGTLTGGQAYLYDGRVWAEAFALWFFAESLRAGAADEGVDRAAMSEFLAGLGRDQLPDGGWTYTGVRGQTGDEAISFVTAAVVLALERAQEIGLEIPDDVLARALSSLGRARLADGTFQYMPALPAALREGWLDGPSGAAGRGPLCALALYSAGRDEPAALRTALTRFMKHRDALKAERGQLVPHTGPEGQASYYFFYDYAFAAQAARALPAEERAKVLAALGADILAIRYADGSYDDNQVIGRAFGTAMAVIVYQQVAQSRGTTRR